ncbi:tetratricopeptide repeat protein [Rhodoferax sp. AJA081-3]|uniref:O-linked N-acetylglucosamine transferase, SPINDLY family protein n=1 Tax=Rhodoferax sp. AJA081-3 TaxID=2752316 RepID=UPI001ADFCE7B|nr:tetratricopeptide repeat protein [Rhodoferax sp. AJA081-3]QTN26728.1 tetratricopeptide repeat protein [Rhodoferax sp. AJA081-3]
MFEWLRSWRRGVQSQPAGIDLAALQQLAVQISAKDKVLAQDAFTQGNQWRERNDVAAAEQHYRQALAIHPAFAEAYCNLGSLMKDAGRLPEADHCLSLALQLKPDLAPACFNLAMMRIDQGQWPDAADLLQRLLKFSPKHAEAQYWLGNALTGSGDVVGARKAYQAAVHLNPAYVQARWGHVMAQLPVIARDEAEQALAPQAFASELEKLKTKLLGTYGAHAYLAVGAQQPYFLAYIEANHTAVLAQYGDLCARLMSTWAGKVGVPQPVVAHAGKCRVGIVSAHVHGHSVWHALLRGWVEHLDPAVFELQIFHTGTGRDAETEWAARRVHTLHHGLGPWTAWAKALSDAQLDILIYPEIGMDATTVRLSALRLARVQLAAWGHPMTTGLPTIDGYISAEAFEPSAAASHYREALLPLPRLGCCYKAFGTAPSHVDFAAWGIQPSDKLLLCPGTPFKYAPQHDAVLVEIARRCQPCKLVFFGKESQPLTRLLEQRLRAAFQAVALDFDACVAIVPWQPQAGFFAFLDRADVYLDSIGFSGFNTVMQAVERAAPIVAFEGEFMRGRFASAALRQMGMDEWVATTTEQFIALVVRMASDGAARAQARRQLADRKAPLFDDRDTVRALADHMLRLAR